MQIFDFVSIRREENLVDAMSKVDILPQLVDIMETGKIKYKVEQLVKRSLPNYKDGTEFETKDRKLPLS